MFLLKKINSPHLLFILFFTFTSASSSQTEKQISDSLKKRLSLCANDTNRLHFLNKLIENESDEKVWPEYNRQMEKLASDLVQNKNKQVSHAAKIFLANALNNYGYTYNIHGDLDKALMYYQKSLLLMKELNDKNGLASAMNNIGYVYKTQGDIMRALEYYHMSLKLNTETGSLRGEGNSLNNIAVILNRQGDYSNGLIYNLKSLEISEKLNDTKSKAITMSNIGLIYHKQNDNKKALEYLNQALLIQKKSGTDLSGLANTYINLGVVYSEKRQAEKSLECYFESVKLLKEADDKQGLSNSYMNIADIYLQKNDLNKCATYANLSYTIAKEIGYLEETYDAADMLSQYYKRKGDYKKALEFHELYTRLRDSSLNESTRKASMQKHFQFTYEKRAAADSVKNGEEQKVKDAQIAAQKSQLSQEQTQKYALYGGVTLLLIFGGYVFNRFKHSNKKNKIIEKQKEIVDEKQKAIIDSILYAKRIQKSLLPTDKYIERNLNRLNRNKKSFF